MSLLMTRSVVKVGKQVEINNNDNDFFCFERLLSMLLMLLLMLFVPSDTCVRKLANECRICVHSVANSKIQKTRNMVFKLKKLVYHVYAAPTTTRMRIVVHCISDLFVVSCLDVFQDIETGTRFLLNKNEKKLGILFYPRPYLLSIISYWRDQTAPLATARYGAARGVGQVLGCCSVFTVFFFRVVLLGWPIRSEEICNARVRSRDCCCGCCCAEANGRFCVFEP
jgi:hypothetical protein